MSGIDVALFGSVFVTMFVIMDPTGLVPIFLAVVGDRPPEQVRRLAGLATITSLGIILSFALFGDAVLSYLHITLPALQGAGGLLLLLVSLQLLLGGQGMPEMTGTDATSVALVPLGTPLLAGPGAIVATILFVRDSDQPAEYAAVAAGIIAIHLVIWLAMRYSTVVMRILKPSGVLILSRIAGVLLAAIAVQLIANSVLGFVLAAQT